MQAMGLLLQALEGQHAPRFRADQKCVIGLGASHPVNQIADCHNFGIRGHPTASSPFTRCDLWFLSAPVSAVRHTSGAVWPSAFAWLSRAIRPESFSGRG